MNGASGQAWSGRMNRRFALLSASATFAAGTAVPAHVHLSGAKIKK